MSATLPIPTPEALQILNLPAEMAANAVFQQHAPLVLASLEEVLDEDAYTALTAADPDPAPDASLAAVSRLAYSFLLLESTCEFLNLKTLGEGIVKSIGLDAASTALLSGDEVEAFKRRLTFRALTILRAWLNDTGLSRLAAAEPSGPKRLRIAII